MSLSGRSALACYFRLRRQAKALRPIYCITLNLMAVGLSSR
ncbi:hypothetical protein BPUTEOMOX_391 [methanotrophic endosymbiont of Bathymodiolus puteoserpentis (Logatchev)]|nr:hypothetical protein BPUTEOMOX_391 [methanotrophic endosymbiont of Bathymodiolus puteoserpentis (Logatchev)]